MYQEWTRDFRCCEIECKKAISSLEEGTLFKWYETKTRRIDLLARKMLSGGRDLTTAHQLPDSETNLTIPSELVTMERLSGTTSKWIAMFMTPRIADIISNVQEEKKWANDWETLNVFFRNPDTRVAAGRQFQKMFLNKFRKQDPDTMPPCYELSKNSGMHLSEKVQ
jgi:hypothetical protein